MDALQWNIKGQYKLSAKYLKVCKVWNIFLQFIILKNHLEMLPKNELYLSYVIVIYCILEGSLLKLNSTEHLEFWLSWKCLFLFTP